MSFAQSSQQKAHNNEAEKIRFIFGAQTDDVDYKFTYQAYP